MYFDTEAKEVLLHGTYDARDTIIVNSCSRYLVPLGDGDTGKGKNSSVYLAVDPDGSGDDLVVKFCNHHDRETVPERKKKRDRFKREITALQRARAEGQQDSIVEIHDHGDRDIDGMNFLYYTMERATCDLTDFLCKNTPALQQKLLLCNQIADALCCLHKLGIYHRDIKPDNVFFFDERWKIGDLGFIRFREEDLAIDFPAERIGPTGRMSPEATNKAFANKNWKEFHFDEDIDDKSDVFQLGMLFWYICQGNLPTGQVIKEDFLVNCRDFFSAVLLPSLQYSKTRRPSVQNICEQFESLRKLFAL